jgi:hypothetical protein
VHTFVGVSRSFSPELSTGKLVLWERLLYREAAPSDQQICNIDEALSGAPVTLVAGR